MQKEARILVIDDEEVVLLGVKKILKNDEFYKYSIDTASSGEQGFDLAKKKSYDVIITDLVMPGIDGMTLLKNIIDQEISARIIMFTGYATMKTALQSLRIGAFDFIAKPFTSEELRGSVQRAIHIGEKEAIKTQSTSKPQKEFKYEPGQKYCIPKHTWAKIEKDYSVTFGIEEDFLENIREISIIELIKEKEKVIQGHGFGKVITQFGVEHTLPSPFSGRVIEVNKKVSKDTSILNKDQGEDIWLIRIDPSEIEIEIENL
ncbi:response regulator [candidate division KSB1 bacterium]